MLEQGAVQIAEMMVAEIADGEPQVLLGKGAKDLRRGPLVLGVFETEQNATAPRPVLGMTQHETDGDTLAFKADGGEIVNDCFVERRDCLTGRLSGHAEPIGLSCDKII
jgi:hypothetical protein